MSHNSEEGILEVKDRRVRKTRQALGEALIALILEKGYESITIKDVTERADVAHATFYRHYRDKDELLLRELQEIVEEISSFTREPSLQDSDGYIIFKHVQENSELYRILVSSPGAVQVRQALQQAIARDLLDTCPQLKVSKQPLIPGEVAAYHMAGSLLMLIEWWLNRAMPYPIQRMAKIYQRLVKEATFDAMPTILTEV